MTFQTEIEAALAKPMDLEINQKAAELANAGKCVYPVAYTLLLRIRELEKQVEQERWRDATKEKPFKYESIVLFKGGAYCFGYWNGHGYSTVGGNPWETSHWKPINLPA